MSIFRRKSSQTDSESLPDPVDDASAETGLDADATDAGDGAGEAEAEDAIEEFTNREDGPWDAAEVDGVGERLDLGAVWLAPVPGAEVRLEVDQSTDTISGLQIVLGDSAAQVQAFAAPRSGGVWRDVRTEISTAISAAGGTVEQVAGPLAPELRVRMPQLAPDGRTVFAPARFVGVDGPRWFLRAVLSGQAAIDEAASAPIIDAIRSMVVVRGDGPMAPREMLALRLPEEPAQPVAETPEDEEADEQYKRPDLNPFERGPEITEVR